MSVSPYAAWRRSHRYGDDAMTHQAVYGFGPSEFGMAIGSVCIRCAQTKIVFHDLWLLKRLKTAYWGLRQETRTIQDPPKVIFA